MPASHIPAAVGDINADGKPDLVTTLSGVINILLNTSTTTAVSFAAPVALTPSPGGSNLTLGDMDGDGRTDIIANSDRASGQVLVYRNTGTGGAVAFTAPAAFSTGTTLDVFVYDLDGDGKMEIITENLSVLQNMSSPGNLIFNSVLSAGNGVFFEQGVSSGIIAADLNADGKPELIAANGVVLPNTSGSGVVSFGTRLNVSVDGNSFYVNVADMDGDGKPDLIFNDPTRTTPGNGTSDDAVSIFRNLSVAGGSLAFDTKLRFVSLGSLRTVIDVNGDGKTDILTRNTGNLLVSLNAILPPVPVITGISPVNGGGPGRTITLTGSSFAELLSISFAGVSQPVYSVSADFTQINLVVPDGATSGDLVVTNGAAVPVCLSRLLTRRVLLQAVLRCVQLRKTWYIPYHPFPEPVRMSGQSLRHHSVKRQYYQHADRQPGKRVYRNGKPAGKGHFWNIQRRQFLDLYGYRSGYSGNTGKPASPHCCFGYGSLDLGRQFQQRNRIFYLPGYQY